MLLYCDKKQSLRLILLPLLSCPSGPGKSDRGKAADIRIKLERSHDHQSSVSHLQLFYIFHFQISACFLYLWFISLLFDYLCFSLCRTVSPAHLIISWISIFRLDLYHSTLLLWSNGIDILYENISDHTLLVSCNQLPVFSPKQSHMSHTFWEPCIWHDGWKEGERWWRWERTISIWLLREDMHPETQRTLGRVTHKKGPDFLHPLFASTHFFACFHIRCLVVLFIIFLFSWPLL